jgi:glycosyltransferase involved in cell wall biosynthesis
MGLKPKLAILFRYGAGEHLDFLPALPELVRELDSRCEVHHFGFRGEADEKELEGLPLRIHTLPFRVRRGVEGDKRTKMVLWLALLPWLGLLLRLRGFRAVFMDETLPLSVSLLRLGYGGRIAMTVHDSFLEMYFDPEHRLFRPAGWIQRMDKRAWRTLDRIFVRVEAAKNQLVKEGFPEDRIVVAHDPANLTLFAPGDRMAARKKWGIREEDFLLVHHGVMHPNKGNVRIVEALARLRDRLPNLRGLLIGEGPELERVQSRCEELGVEDIVRCTGWLGSLREVAEALNAADAGLAIRTGLQGDHFHVTSTLVHNLSCGLPVIAAKLEGMMEIVEDGREGFLVDPACGGDFDAAVLRLAADSELRARMSHAARQTAERCFDRERIGREMAEGLLSLC